MCRIPRSPKYNRSNTRIEYPRASNSSASTQPRYPAPPTSRMRLIPSPLGKSRRLSNSLVRRPDTECSVRTPTAYHGWECSEKNPKIQAERPIPHIVELNIRPIRVHNVATTVHRPRPSHAGL